MASKAAILEGIRELGDIGFRVPGKLDQVERLAESWQRHNRHVPDDAARAAFKLYAVSVETQTLNLARFKRCLGEVMRGREAPVADDYHRWVRNWPNDIESPCPICGARWVWTTTGLRLPCDPDQHAQRGQPVIGPRPSA